MALTEVKLTELVNRDLLAGGSAGDHDRGTVSGAISPTDDLVVLDFSGVRVLTPSYFKRCLLPLWFEWEVVLGMKEVESVQEDLLACLHLHSLATWKLTAHPEILGELDSSAIQTVEHCLEFGCVTAVSLSERFPKIRSTTWSNRLAGLFEGRLLMRKQQGRRLEYCLPWHWKGAKSDGR